MFHPEGPTFLELVRQALSSTERGYDLLAPKFDLTPFRTPDEVILATLSEIGEQVDSALDLCCGTGAAMRWLRPHCRSRVVGIDFSEGMLAEAQRRLGPGFELVHGDVLAMDFEAEFDVATCFGAFGHVLPKDEDRFLDGVRRALVPGGRFLFATAERPPPMSMQRVVAHAFNAAMHVRNLLWRPRFIMYYLSFVLPDVVQQLERHGFSVRVTNPRLAPPFHPMRVVVATRVVSQRHHTNQHRVSQSQ